MQLLVSVRSAEEAAAALAGGAAIIDVKEPSRGPLGRADDAVVQAVLQTVGGLRPVSAALGELPEGGMQAPPIAVSLTFVKWGLAGRGADDSWLADFLWSAAGTAPPLPKIPSPPPPPPSEASIPGSIPPTPPPPRHPFSRH